MLPAIWIMQRYESDKRAMLKSIKIVLLSIICVLGYTLWHQLNKPITFLVNGDTDKKLVVANELSISDLQIENPLISDFDEMIERPLFFEDRKPYVYVEPEKAAPIKKKKQKLPLKKNDHYSLSAVTITANKKIVIIQSGRDKAMQRLSLGESIDDWILEEIKPRSVLLKKGDEIKSLELEIKTSIQKTATKTNNKTIKKELTEKKSEKPKIEMTTPKT